MTSKRSVLIVEDNELNREILQDILEEQYHVICAVDGVDGLEKMHAYYQSISLVFLDVQMPRMNGYEFLERYHKDKLFTQIPVIVTTGSNTIDEEVKCLTLGASDFVTKPYNPNVILRRAESMIRLRESVSTLAAVEFDEMTGLYNKNAFQHHARLLLDQNEVTDFDMIMVNIEDFGYYNERYGEQDGNELLKYVGHEIRRFAKDGQICSRYNADRFVILAETVSQEELTKSIEAFNATVNNGEKVHDFVLRYGVYQRVDRSAPVNLLCDRIAAALSTVRHQYAQSIAFYDDQMFQKSRRMHQIEECMEQALLDKQFKVYYQPKHDPYTNKVVGAEALVRWTHPQYGFMSPGDFIPLFEKNGFITPLDFYVWRTVSEDLKKWKEKGLPLVPISVNASRRDFIATSDIASVDAALEEAGIDKNYMHIEITESLCMDDELVFSRVKQVHDQGYRIEMDDFGSGYSSLGMICDIPMDIIKLDMSFMRQIDKQKEVVRMIVSLAHALGLKIVAEGVENEHQLDLLREFGCDYIQGYCYSKPIPELEFEEYLRIHG